MVDPAFASSDEARWKSAAEAGLAGASFERALVGVAPEGFAVEPLYLARHLPKIDIGVAFAASSQPIVAQRYSVTAPARANAEIVEDLGRGVALPWLSFEPDTNLAVKLGVTLAGVPATTPILLDAGEAALDLAGQARRLGFSRVSALCDPFSTALRQGGLKSSWAVGFDRAHAEAVEAGGAGVTSLAVSPAAVFDAGGDMAQAIGFALAGAAAWARAFDSRNRVDLAASSLAVIVSPGSEVFRGIALLRALSIGFAKLWSALGVAGPRPLFVGVGSQRALSGLDVETNMIRATLETFSLIVGGADVVATRPFDEPSATRSALGRRLAKNTALVLLSETELGKVRDPAAGSYYVESLSGSLARAGWAELNRIETEGGLEDSLEAGLFQERVRHASAARERDIVRRKRVLVGTSEYATTASVAPTRPIAEASGLVTLVSPLRSIRDAAPFESLRASVSELSAKRGRPLSGLLIGLGPAASYRAREAFMRRLFEVAGFAVDLLPDPSAAAATESAWLEQAISSRTPDAVVLIGSDEIYQSAAEAVVLAAKRAGSPAIVLAGKPGDLAAPLHALGMTHSVAVGDDVVAVLSSVVELARGAS